jgi:hypothetical protein
MCLTVLGYSVSPLECDGPVCHFVSPCFSGRTFAQILGSRSLHCAMLGRLVTLGPCAVSESRINWALVTRIHQNFSKLPQSSVPPNSGSC